jgi:hypothetical protein
MYFAMTVTYKVYVTYATCFFQCYMTSDIYTTLYLWPLRPVRRSSARLSLSSSLSAASPAFPHPEIAAHIPILLEYHANQPYNNSKVDLMHVIAHQYLMHTKGTDLPECIEEPVNTTFNSCTFKVLASGFLARRTLDPSSSQSTTLQFPMPLNPIANKSSPAAAAVTASRLPLIDLAAPVDILQGNLAW